MSLLSFIRGFLKSDIGKEIEGLTLDELLALLKKIYPQEKTLIAIVAKIEDEIKKLQGIK